MDYVTLETGLGGRMDATTAVENPVACVITSISLDHMQYLGDTVAKIAGEKAGIIVSGVPVIYDGNDPDAAEVISAKAKEMGSPAYEVKRTDTEIIRNTSSGIDFSFRNEYYGDTVFLNSVYCEISGNEQCACPEDDRSFAGCDSCVCG